jgi:hypothetical protein
VQSQVPSCPLETEQEPFDLWIGRIDGFLVDFWSFKFLLQSKSELATLRLITPYVAVGLQGVRHVRSDITQRASSCSGPGGTRGMYPRFATNSPQLLLPSEAYASVTTKDLFYFSASGENTLPAVSIFGAISSSFG